MPRRAAVVEFHPLHVDPKRAVPLVRQLYDELRGAVLDGRLAPGARLPSTRALSARIGVSRNTVLAAFEQLAAEGYVEGRVGAGTRIAKTRPEHAFSVAQVETGAIAPARPADRPGRLSRRGARLATTLVTVARGTGKPMPFRPGLPAIDHFPTETWRRLTARFWAAPPPSLLGYGDASGHEPLRAAIAEHLRAARGVRCDASQVLVVSGSQHALDLVARVLLDPGDRAWIEDPGYVGARAALLAAGAALVPLDVDPDGMVVEQGVKRAPRARLAYVSPSHQYPTGAVLSLARRLALLSWARRARAWIVEDDYDSEFRYVGWPLESLAGLDGGERVLYVGTFSKVLLPGLRLGYLVVPKPLVAAFANARGLMDRHPPGPEQAVLADFVAEGHFARHLRRMRTLYAERQQALLDAAARHWGDRIALAPEPAGMHLLGRLPKGVDDVRLSAAAERLGVEAPPLSRYAIRRLPRGGLVLGYAAYEPKAIEDAARRLAGALGGGA
jgi:GntR family transcriptional regulator/MocR family aminotransferase